MSTTSTARSSTAAAASFQGVCSVEDVLSQLMQYLNHQDVGRLESVAKFMPTLTHQSTWRILCLRDYEETEMTAPSYQNQSFESLDQVSSWKACYQKWIEWSRWTHFRAKPHHLREAINLWSRYKKVLVNLRLNNILESLCPCLTHEEFGSIFQSDRMALPSSLVAFYSVHGGQQKCSAQFLAPEFAAGVFGLCALSPDALYCMRLFPMTAYGDMHRSMNPGTTVIGVSPGRPAHALFLDTRNNEPEGILSITYLGTDQHVVQRRHAVGRGGILPYFGQYVEHLEAGIFKNKPCSLGIGLFPDAGLSMSCAVTRGIEVQASARWLPDEKKNTLNFAYSIRMRIRRVDPCFDACQLVSRHWEFKDGNGKVRLVNEEAIGGKQPLFFRDAQSSGYIDLGSSGDGKRYPKRTFVFEGQYGPVEGTSTEDTGVASVRGSFRCIPGNIADPTGEPFDVVMARFPLSVPFPFY